jgi:hypothetical protein
VISPVINNYSLDPITHAFDEKHKLVSGPKQDFSIKISLKYLFTNPKNEGL